MTATFVPKPILTVSLTGNGSGSVTSHPAGIGCGADCSEAYDPGTRVTVTATPGSVSVFLGWGGACRKAGAWLSPPSAST